jgi:hypothetical protein
VTEETEDDTFSESEIAAIDAALEAAALAEAAGIGCSDLGPRERICSVGQLVHIGPCWCADLPMPAALAAPVVAGVWQPVDVWLRAAGLSSPLPQIAEVERAEWAA